MYVSTNKQMNKLLKRLLVAGTDHKLLAFVHSVISFLAQRLTTVPSTNTHISTTSTTTRAGHSSKTAPLHPAPYPFNPVTPPPVLGTLPQLPTRFSPTVSAVSFAHGAASPVPLILFAFFSFFYSYLSLASQQNSINLCHIANHCVRTLDEALLMR